MSETSIEQRKRWYHHFPEGSLEFLVATRVLAIVLLLALLVVTDIQRPVVLSVLVGVLWCDYALMLGWAVQTSLDLDLLAGQSVPPVKRWAFGLQVFLPSVVVACTVAPWPSAYLVIGRIMPSLARQGGVRSETYGQLSLVGYAAAVLLFLVLAAVGYRALRRIGLGGALWTALLFVPGMHWFAIHRIAAGLHRRIEASLASSDKTSSMSVPAASMALADVTWALCVVPWGVIFAVALIRGWPSVWGPFCGMLLAAVFAIAELAAIERVQRHFVHRVRQQ